MSPLFAQPFVQAQVKRISKLYVTGLCEGISPVTGEFPTQMASNAEIVSIRWRHHEMQIAHQDELQAYINSRMNVFNESSNCYSALNLLRRWRLQIDRSHLSSSLIISSIIYLVPVRGGY